MERRDLDEDDLTEERQPTPAQRDEVASQETLDPDASADDAERKPMPKPGAVAGKSALGYPGGVPGGVKDDPLVSG